MHVSEYPLTPHDIAQLEAKIRECQSEIAALEMASKEHARKRNVASWEKKFRSYLFSNHLIEKAFTSLCKAGCLEQSLLNHLWHYSAMRLNSSRSKIAYKKVRASGKQLRVFAQRLQQVADAFVILKQSQGDLSDFHRHFIDQVEQRLGGNLTKRLWAESGFIVTYARSWERGNTIKKMNASSDFDLAYLAEYVRARTGRAHHKELLLLLEAAWAGHGMPRAYWSIDMLQSRLRRVPSSERTLIADILGAPRRMKRS